LQCKAWWECSRERNRERYGKDGDGSNRQHEPDHMAKNHSHTPKKKRIIGPGAHGDQCPYSHVKIQGGERSSCAQSCRRSAARHIPREHEGSKLSSRFSLRQQRMAYRSSNLLQLHEPAWPRRVLHRPLCHLVIEHVARNVSIHAFETATNSPSPKEKIKVKSSRCGPLHRDQYPAKSICYKVLKLQSGCNSSPVQSPATCKTIYFGSHPGSLLRKLETSDT
jgi:hypothetical protein